MKDFKNKVAVITGAASGIGRGLANKAIEEGMKVVLADIEEESLSQTEKELKAEGADIIAVPTDVTKLQDIRDLAQKTLDTYGSVHLLCNNAGVGYCMDTSTYSWDSSITDWNWILDVNLKGVVNGINVFVPIMLKQDTKCQILNTASIAGLVSPVAGIGIYSISKHAVVALSESLNGELQLINSKIKVSALCPAFVSTNLVRSERNRPMEPTLKPGLDDKLKIHIETTRKAIDAGMSPDKVSDIAFQGMKNDFFYILPHVGLAWKKLVSHRTDGIAQAFQENKLLQKSMRG